MQNQSLFISFCSLEYGAHFVFVIVMCNSSIDESQAKDKPTNVVSLLKTNDCPVMVSRKGSPVNFGIFSMLLSTKCFP